MISFSLIISAAVHINLLSYTHHIYHFTGIIELTIKLTIELIIKLSSVVECLHRNRKGHEFESRRCLKFSVVIATPTVAG